MMDKNKNNPFSYYVVFGVFTGIIFLVLFYIVLFSVSGRNFTFSFIVDFHNKYILLYLIDFFPVVTGIIGYLFYLRIRHTQWEMASIIEKEKIANQKAIGLLGKLKTGHFNEWTDSDSESNLILSLYELKTILQENREKEEQRKKEDKQRNWISEGLAMFGELLRQPGDNMEDFAYMLLSNLVKYLDANQGGFFSIEENTSGGKYFEMLACYAYDRRKFPNKKLEWGTGLIGTCALEKKTIYMNNIPDSYLLITSGLGKANPGNLLLVPLLAGDNIFGVLEIASFKKIEEFHISFCEKVAGSIALTISTIKNSIRTALLLKETRAQAEELSVQEEMVRQNMEELKATQERAAQQAEKFISFTDSVNHTMIRAEFDTNGILIYANTKFLKKMGFSGNREVEGKHISLFIHERDREWFNNIWESLGKGGKHFEGYMKYITKQGQDLWTMATYTCIRREDGSVEKILFLAIDTTEQKKQSLDFEGQIEALNKLNLKAEFTPDGKLLNNNELFINTLKFPAIELELKTIYDFLDRRDLEAFNEIWEGVIKGNAYQGQIRLKTKYDEEKWFRSTFTVVNNMYGEVDKVVFLSNEISNEKIMETESRKQTERLKMQEEKLRLNNIEMERRMEEEEQKWIEKYRIAEETISLTGKILDNQKELIISIDNSGHIVYLNNVACKFWKLKKKEVSGLPALRIFDVDNGSFPDFFIDLTDPAKAKKENTDIIVLPGYGSNKESFRSRMLTTEQNGRIIYTAFFSHV